jgi:hypothetical protein
VDPGERARRAQQAADERAQQAADERREHERREHERVHMLPAWKGKSTRRRRKEEIVKKVAETVVVKKTPWQVAVAALKDINKHLRLESLQPGGLRKQDGSPYEMTKHDVYYIVRKPEIWSGLTSLRKR